jgi:hypothetical protein
VLKSSLRFSKVGTENMTWELISGVGSKLIYLLVGILFGNLVLPYLKRKSENVATKEDIEEITAIIESVKLEYSRNLEEIKIALGTKLYIHQTRYEKEFDILLELSEKLVALRDAAVTLRPEFGYRYENETEEEEKDRKLCSFHAASRAFYAVYEKRQPFYPEELYKILVDLHSVSRIEMRQYATYASHEQSGYWEKAAANAETISGLTEDALAAVRERIKRWETLEFSELE